MAPPPRNQKGKSWTSAAAFERDWPSFLFNPLFSHTHGEGGSKSRQSWRTKPHKLRKVENVPGLGEDGASPPP